MSIVQFHETNDYKKKITELKNEIKSSKIKSKEVEDSITYETNKWNEMYEEMQSQMKENIQNGMDKMNIGQIRELMDQIKDIERNIKQV